MIEYDPKFLHVLSLETLGSESHTSYKYSHSLCAMFWFTLTQRVHIFHMKVSSGLFNYTSPLLLKKGNGKSSTGGVSIFSASATYIHPYGPVLPISNYGKEHDDIRT